MTRANAVAALLLASLSTAACKLSTGGGGDHHGANTITYFTDDFSGGTLNNWVVDTGAPAINTTLGDPAPSVAMSTAEIRNTTGAATNGGYTLSADIKVVAGVASFRVVQPGVGPVALVKVWRNQAYYAICPGATCASNLVAFAPDNDWHQYTFVYDAAGATTRWMRDGQALMAAGDIGIHTGMLIKAGMYLVNDTGSSLGYYDNFRETSP